MRAEFIQLESAIGNNMNKLLRRDGPKRRTPIDRQLLILLLKARQSGLPISFKKL